jgi:hypothetical protein
MDLGLLARVLWRFRLLAVCGFIAALMLAMLSYTTIELDGGLPKIRGPVKEWQSDATLFVTEGGAPWGRSTLESAAAAGDASAFSDPNRFIGLAALYARLADSDEVRQILLRDGPIPAEYSALPVKSSDGSTLLPLIAVLGHGETPSAAVALANRVATAFQTYLLEKQNANKIKARERVELPFLNRATKATVFETPSPAKPVFIFVLVFGLTVAIAFVLENVRPRRRDELAEEQAPTAQTATIARSARSA